MSWFKNPWLADKGSNPWAESNPWAQGKPEFEKVLGNAKGDKNVLSQKDKISVKGVSSDVLKAWVTKLPLENSDIFKAMEAHKTLDFEFFGFNQDFG